MTLSIIEKVPFKKAMYIALLIATIVNIGVSYTHTPWYGNQNTQSINDIKELLGETKTSFLVDFQGYQGERIYSRAVYSYAPIYVNITTPNGWYDHAKENQYLEMLWGVKEAKTCEEFNARTGKLNVGSLIAFKERCAFFQSCNWNIAKEKGDFCLATRE